MIRGLTAALALVFGAGPSQAAPDTRIEPQRVSTQAAKRVAPGRVTRAHYSRNTPAPRAAPIFRDARARATFCDQLEAVAAAIETPGAPRVCAKDRRRLQRLSKIVRRDAFFRAAA